MPNRQDIPRRNASPARAAALGFCSFLMDGMAGSAGICFAIHGLKVKGIWLTCEL
jgi:hypothetical protein